MANVTDEKVKESIHVRGVCDQVSGMALPTVDNLIHLFGIVGITLVRLDK